MLTVFALTSGDFFIYRPLKTLHKTIGWTKSMERKGNKPRPSQAPSKPISPALAEARRLLAIVEKSQVPFGESAPIFARIKAQIDSGKSLSVEDHEHLMRLVKIAKDWNKAEESSAMTEPDETLSG